MHIIDIDSWGLRDNAQGSSIARWKARFTILSSLLWPHPLDALFVSCMVG